MADRGIIFSAAMVRALLDGRKTQTRRLLKNQPPEWATFCQQPQMLSALGQWVPSGLWRWSEPEQAPPRALREWPIDQEASHYWLRPAFQRGDRLYVRESWRVSPDAAEGWHPEELRGYIDYQARGSEERVAPSFEAVERAAFLKGEDRDWDFLPSRYRPCIHMPRWTSRLWLAVTDVRVQRLQECGEVDALAEGIDRIEYPETGDWGWPQRRYAELWNSLHTTEGKRWGDNPWIVAVTFDVHRGNIDEAVQ